MSLVKIVHEHSKQIEDERSIFEVFRHMCSEMDELNEELNFRIDKKEPGEDGITGEAIDVIACAIDLILIENKDVPVDKLEQVINRIMTDKCSKWVYKSLTGAYDLGR